jgi:hypothetical protein
MPVSISGDGTLTGVDPALSGFGLVKQMISAVDTTDRTTTSQTYQSASLTVSITPTSADSDIYVWWYAEVSSSRALSDDLTQSSFRITQGGTAVPGAEDVTIARRAGAINPATLLVPICLFGKFNPSDTSELTFSAEYKSDLSSITTSITNSGTSGHMIVMEVAA